MVCMNTKVRDVPDENNERLKALVAGAGLTQVAALALFNKDIKVRPLSESAWKGYFCAYNSKRYRGFSQELLAHAEKVFGKQQPKFSQDLLAQAGKVFGKQKPKSSRE